MANEKNPKRRKRLRQQWDPHWLIKLVYAAFSVLMSLVKVAAMAGATVLLIVLICGAVFVGTLGDYLQEVHINTIINLLRSITHRGIVNHTRRINQNEL